MYSEVKIDSDTIITAKQIKELQKKCDAEEENLIIKSDCHIHATLKQRIHAFHTLRFQHNIKTLCRVLQVNRSTYYKHFSKVKPARILENEEIKRRIAILLTSEFLITGAICA